MAIGRGFKGLMVILGPPGSGKGTYASLLARHYNLMHLSIGDIAREAFKDPRHLALKQLMDAGQFLPDKDIAELMSMRLRGAQQMLLDGFPRTLKQAQILESEFPVSMALRIHLQDEHIIAKIAGRRICGSCGRSYNLADVHDVQNDVIMPPILPSSSSKSTVADPLCDVEPLCDCGGSLEKRADDAPAVVAERLRLHHAEEEALLEFYAARGVLLNHRVRRGMGDMADLVKNIDAFSRSSKQASPHVGRRGLAPGRSSDRILSAGLAGA